MEEEHMETGKMLIKEHKRELGSAPKVSNLNDQDERDSISVQLDAILKKGTQSLQETSDHRLQMTNILASLDYCHLEASLEKTARQVSNLRDKVNLLHSRHDKLVTCLKSYNQQVSDCKSNIEVWNSVRARLETFGLQESPQEVSLLQVQVVKLNSILAQLDASVEWSAQIIISLQKSDRQVSAMEDQVGHLIEQNRRFEDDPLDNSVDTVNLFKKC
ncbi:hypothetical protein LIER_39721 [Lithospermum erythrorhizon]|uniref:Uncharacterized protein n=1 Tax=Lithospermum erythrorhizon TaxID=34254 RepID=A0AAV3QK92_LITER